MKRNYHFLTLNSLAPFLSDIIQDHSQEGPMVTEMAVIMADLAKTAKSAQNEALKYRK